MLAKFRALPLTVRAAIFVLIFMAALGLTLIPEFVLPLLAILAVAGSILRIMIYLIHDV